MLKISDGWPCFWKVQKRVPTWGQSTSASEAEYLPRWPL